MENKATNKPGIIIGAVVGTMLTTITVVVFYLGEQIAGLPFVPFDIFNWVRDSLPGDIITAGVDAMIDVVTTFDVGRVDTVGKTIEQFSAVGMLLAIGILVGAAFFAWSGKTDKDNHTVRGLLTGIVMGFIIMLVSADKNVGATAEPIISAIWIMVVFALWGEVLGEVYRRLIMVDEDQAEQDATVSAKQLSRRDFLVKAGGATAVITIVGGATGLLLNSGDDDNSDTRLSDIIDNSAPEATPEATQAVVSAAQDDNSGWQSAPGTRPEYTPLEDHYRIDISPSIPHIDEADWRLEVTGLLAAPIAMTLEEIVTTYEGISEIRTISCISNRIGGSLIGTTRWTGVPFHLLLDAWDIDEEAAYLKISSVDGFFEYVSIDLIREDERVMLAYAWDGKPLEDKHGFPVRIHIPDRYGMKQPKWITNIEVVDEWEEGYWLKRGWSIDAIVQTTSVIDTIATDDAYEADGQMFVPIGGIAYAGAKGISKVEVRFDDGEWQEAQMKAPQSELTWVLWRYDWPFEEGRFRFCVRCTDANGVVQIEEDGNREPDGKRGANVGLHCERN
jgi:DMSO/TMAO reductase YedYZ molybdopterin-dependent catalytic subunit